MPLYDYKCTQCGRVSEVKHGFSETLTEPCPQCGGPLKRVFNPAPVLFKGSGFYVTDSRKSRAASEPSPPAAEEKPKTESVSKPETPSSGSAKPESKSSESAA